jgi:glycosyltransferase involved in cell wall biosynthesis
VVIPVHDEARTVARIVEGALRHVRLAFVVDDGSCDGSAEEALRAGARVMTWTRRRGKGAALRAGLDWAFAEAQAAAVTLDGDGQHLASEIPRFLAAHASGARLVVGDRSAEFGRMPIARRTANRVLTAALRPLAGPGLRDSQCGFRLISAGVWRSLATRCEHFDFESEVLIAARRAGIEVVQVPVSVVYGTERSKIRVGADSARFVAMAIRAVATMG